MITLNKKLVNELETPFHSYLLFSNLASNLLSQSKMFAMSLSFNSIDYVEHPDIKIIESENLTLYFLFITLIGGSLVSNTSGIKLVRFYILLKIASAEILKLINYLR